MNNNVEGNGNDFEVKETRDGLIDSLTTQASITQPTCPTLAEVPLEMHPIFITVSMEDFQALRAAARVATRPRVAYNPTDTKQMAKDAAKVTVDALTSIKLILDKYEFMEQEGFAGPNGCASETNKPGMCRQDINHIIQGMSSWQNSGDNFSLRAFHKELESEFGLLIPQSDIKGMSISSIIGYLYNCLNSNWRINK